MTATACSSSAHSGTIECHKATPSPGETRHSSRSLSRPAPPVAAVREEHSIHSASNPKGNCKNHCVPTPSPNGTSRRAMPRKATTRKAGGGGGGSILRTALARLNDPADVAAAVAVSVLLCLGEVVGYPIH